MATDSALRGLIGRARRAIGHSGTATSAPPAASPAYLAAHRQASDTLALSRRILDLYEGFLANAPEDMRDAYQAERDLYEDILRRRSVVMTDHATQVTLERRFDDLYYADAVDFDAGADHWPEGRLPGRAHVSINIGATYVNIPAALQAIEPVYNYLPVSSSPADRDKAQRAERLFFGWRRDTRQLLTEQDVCRTKALYGTGWLRVLWDDKAKLPRILNVDIPSNLWVGWGSSDFTQIDWTAYCYLVSADSAQRLFGVNVELAAQDGISVPWVSGGTHADPLDQLTGQDSVRRRLPPDVDIEVIDYWYYGPGGAVTNVIYAGAHQVQPPRIYGELDRLPYIPVRNGHVNGRPYGKSDLYDIEQLLREKDERISNQAQLLSSVVGRQMWQLVGPDAPDEVPPNVVPSPNAIIAPGPGNQVVPITPWFPEFQAEDYNRRIDRELAATSGLNDLLLGLAPAQVLSSSKAVAALVANYESRLLPLRQVLYSAYLDAWEMVVRIWSKRDKEVAAVFDGNYRIDISAPELTPRDSLETASMAMQLASQRIWSMERAMDATGVDDTGAEKSIIREEQTDASLNPGAVQAQMQLLAVAKSLNEPPPPQAQQLAAAQQASLTQAQTQATARALQRPVRGSSSNNAPENSTQGEPAPGASEAGVAPGQAPLLGQTMLEGGKATGRILSQSPLG